MKYHHMMPVWSMTTWEKRMVGVTWDQWHRLKNATGVAERDAIYHEILTSLEVQPSEGVDA